MNKPIIGMTGYRDPVRIPSFRTEIGSSISETYLKAITQAGGNPILIPTLEEYKNNPGQILDIVDGLVIIGGIDVNPKIYGQTRHPMTDESDNLRDQTELALIKEALKRDLPLLGICRGMQIMNVAAGGILHQHLSDNFGNSVMHGSPKNDAFYRHTIKTVEGSLLRSIYGEKVEISSAHHQCVDEVGKGFTVAALAEDGLIEGIENKQKSFCIGVQWHPEEDMKENLPLFEQLLSSAKKYQVSKKVTE